jgi:aminoglycoside/choline kinase family phosphotransferase
MTTTIKNLFQNWANESVETLKALPASGSDRKYYRITGKTKTAIAAFNPNEAENRAFINFTNHFKTKGIRVPEIYAEDLVNGIYLQQDLGDLSLYQHLLATRNGKDLTPELLDLYQKSVEELAKIQMLGHEGLDYENWCFQITEFDKQSMLWDLNYFKYYFLKVSGLAFDEAKLESDFQRLADFLDEANREAFMFRDFQARNIMLFENEPYLIDYQGGRRGAMPYDLASLLTQAKADIPLETRDFLLNHYLKTAAELNENFDELAFKKYYFPFVLIRVIQVLGAYGFRGLYEKKPHFLSSIPFAMKNVVWVLNQLSTSKSSGDFESLDDYVDYGLKIPYLKETLSKLTTHQDWNQYLPAEISPSNRSKLGEAEGEKGKLTVTVSSFSYKRGIPLDLSGNGGGHVFDCRAIHNPGRYEPYKKITGRNEAVIDFLLKESNITEFVENAKRIVIPSVERYLERGFSSLMVSFGCTGGQHRSVYSCDQMAKFLREKYEVNVVVNHVEQEIKGWIN